MPAALAAALGLAPGTPVALTPLPALPPAAGVTVEPAGPDDWELVECHAGDVEADLLTQVGVVAVGQPFPYWVRPGGGGGGGMAGLVGGRPILLTVTAAAPGPAVRLVRGTEVAVAPRPRARAGEAIILRGSVNGPAGAGPPPPAAAEPALPPPPLVPPPPPLWLRVQEAEAGPSFTLPLDPPPWRTVPSTTVWVCPAAAGAAGLAAGDVVSLAVRLGPGAPAAHAALAVGPPPGAPGPLSPGHVILPTPLARAIGAAPLGRVALVRAAAAGGGDPPSLVLLRPDKGAGGAGGPAGRLAGLPPAALGTLFASWLAVQAGAGPGGGGGGGGVGRGPAPPVVLAEGALVRLSLPHPPPLDREATTTHPPPPFLDAALELHWPGGGRRPGRPILLDPAAGGAGGVRVEVGGPADLLPMAAAAQPAAEPTAAAAPWSLFPSSGPAPPPPPPAPWIARHVPAGLVALLPALDARARAALAAGTAASSASAAASPAARAGLLITGPPGCGKSSLASALASALSAHPASRAGVVRVDCRGWDVADAPADARADLEDALAAAARVAPALLVLEDLDVLGSGGASTPSMGEALDPAGAGGAALGVWLAEALGGKGGGGGGPNPAALYPPSLPLAVVVTATDAAAVPSGLRHLLPHSLALPALSASGRAAVLQAALAARGAAVSRADARRAAADAEGCDAADLTALADRAVHAAAGRCAAAHGPGGGGSGHGPPAVTAADLAAAAVGFEPSSAWAASAPAGSRSSSAPAGWEDVGGLESARAALVAALDPFHSKRGGARTRRRPRPTPPLRPRTGVLLYGPPGCGKSHALAAAVAAAGARVVAVKGPELLNKYIGASEAAVRAVFARAAAASPCVLLFDEFESLAPRRGADSTGVTDRVVNQLLTELDGATGLTGVVVLAATSRPDLVDPALLRPGRLDRSVYCGPPADAPTRLAILTALARRAGLAPDAVGALAAIADATPGFTGADLGAVLAEAQLAAVHAALEEGGDTPASTTTPPLITAAHLRAALATARPSLPPVELARLEAVYARFAGRDVRGGREAPADAEAAAAAQAASAAARTAAKGKAPLVLRDENGRDATTTAAGGLLAALELGEGHPPGSRVTMK